MLLQVETREDEEQNVKLQQTIELLLAAGYFRARIKGLSPFDKVIILCFSTYSNLDSELNSRANSGNQFGLPSCKELKVF